jgi:hypothetical protein
MWTTTLSTTLHDLEKKHKEAITGALHRALERLQFRRKTSKSPIESDRLIALSSTKAMEDPNL